MTKGAERPRLDEATEAVLETGREEFESLLERIGSRFFRAEARDRVRRYLSGLLGPVRRRNGWQLSEQIGESTPDGVQRLMNEARWDADLVRDDLRDYVIEHLGDPDAVLVVDETGFLKKGAKSVGVARQYSGTAGRVENCQVGVFLSYASPRGRTFLDRALYLPDDWAKDSERRREAGVPEEVAFRKKSELALEMIERALDAGVPAGWVTGDSIYGGDRQLRIALEERGQPFVLGVAKSEPLWSWDEEGPNQTRADARADRVAEDGWRRLSAGAGSKGPRLYDWAFVPLNRPGWPHHSHGLLVRRSLADPTDRAYYVTFAPKGTPIEAMVRAAGSRWTIEESFESAKGEVGLDEYEVRKWDAWHRYVTLSLLVHAYLTVLRAKAMIEPESRTEEKGGRI